MHLVERVVFGLRDVLGVLGLCCLLAACTGGATSPVPSPTFGLLSPTKPAPDKDWQARWLEGIPCRAPCWEGITPGKTTADQAVQSLAQSPVATNIRKAIAERDPEFGWVTWDWVAGGQGGQATFDGRTTEQYIQVIELRGLAFRLGDVMTGYGEPTSILASEGHGPDRGAPLAYAVGILYERQGFVLPISSPDKPVLNSNLVLEVSFFSTPADIIPHPERFKPWQGMRDFDYYCQDSEGKQCR